MAWLFSILILDCSGLPGRTSLRHSGHVGWRRPPPAHCSGLPGRTSLRRLPGVEFTGAVPVLFRPSRPDFIETAHRPLTFVMVEIHCSGLPGRTSLRPDAKDAARPTRMLYCFGLPGRTSLRRNKINASSIAMGDCSGLPGRTSLRLCC